MLIQFTIWGEYDELTKPDGEVVGLLRLKLNHTTINEEECHRYSSPNDQESAILNFVGSHLRRVIVADG